MKREGGAPPSRWHLDAALALRCRRFACNQSLYALLVTAIGRYGSLDRARRLRVSDPESGSETE